jgi:hypothetical protein
VLCDGCNNCCEDAGTWEDPWVSLTADCHLKLELKGGEPNSPDVCPMNDLYPNRTTTIIFICDMNTEDEAGYIEQAYFNDDRDNVRTTDQGSLALPPCVR